ncbi:MAG: hypothetical protein Q9184_003597 [Pyrenodesmia sp. 2 TL-2023]
MALESDNGNINRPTSILANSYLSDDVHKAYAYQFTMYNFIAFLHRRAVLFYEHAVSEAPPISDLYCHLCTGIWILGVKSENWIEEENPHLDTSGLNNIFHIAVRYRETLEDYTELLEQRLTFFHQHCYTVDPVLFDLYEDLRNGTGSLLVKTRVWQQDAEAVIHGNDAWESRRRYDRMMIKRREEYNRQAKRQRDFEENNESKRQRFAHASALPNDKGSEPYVVAGRFTGSTNIPPSFVPGKLVSYRPRRKSL